ncbi:MAG TPA: InlB B-repeat-containing protein, partial [Methanocorpusculum sp.]|nr:InlB B-repeat-containing protein [Methanocorpusculum sp.]
EGTDENTEFTLLHYLDLHREYFTDEDLNSKTEPVTVSKTGSGVQFSIPQSGFSPFALIWSDQKPVPIPPSGGGSSDGNMDNAFRVLFNDGATTLFVVTDLSYGDKLTKPEDPVKDGYTFAGWHKDAACTQAWDFADGIAGDMTLYAKWTPVQTVTPTVTPTATASVTPTVTAEPSGLPTTTPTVQPTGEDDGDKPAGSVLPLIGGILILILAVLLLLFLLLRHTVTFLIPTGGEITEHRIKVWHGRYIDPADLPELLRTAVWYRDPARQERWDFNEDRVTKSIELYLG